MSLSSAQTVLVTGASGFVGRALCEVLSGERYRVRGTVRSAETISPSNRPGVEFIAVGPLGCNTGWQRVCSNVDYIVHLAARTHFIGETSSNALEEYRRINVEGTRQVARIAAHSGVRRFIYVSSIKVNGESTGARAFSAEDPPGPEDAYGISKWEAEQALFHIASESGMEVIILRPPLVYGPGVKGNFLRLLGLIMSGTPLPLASIHNRRSLIYVGNLADAIVSCMVSATAAGKTYLVGDGDDVSTPHLIRLLATALGVPARLFPFPQVLFKVGGAMLGKSGAVTRLTGSLQIDIGKIRNDLSWRPPFSLADGIEQTAQWYRKIGSG